MHQGYVRVQIITLRRLTVHRMAVHAARTLDHLGRLDEQSHRTRALVADIREGRGWLERHDLGSRRPNGGGSEKGNGQAAFRRVRHDLSKAVSIGSVRMRLPVAAKIALVTAGATAAVGASPMPPGA